MDNKKPRIKKDIEIYNIDKVPPNAMDLEEVVLGAIILESHVLIDLAFLKSEMFYNNAHRIIYDAILSLKDKEMPIDAMLIINELNVMHKLEEIGGVYTIVQLTNKVSSSANCPYHARIIYQMYLKREIIRLSNNAINMAYDQATDVFELIDALRLELEALDLSTNPSEGINTINALETTIKKIKHNMMDQVKTYYETGWESFDKTVGIAENEIMLLGGPAGHGKTKFTIAMICKLFERHAKDMSVDWYTFEDPSDKIIRNMIAIMTGISDEQQKSKRLKLNTAQLNAILSVKQMISTWDISFHESPMSIKTINYGFQRFCEKRKGRFNLCVIDNALLLKESPYLKSNERDDFIMGNISIMRQTTKGLILLIHHFNDSQQAELNVKIAYRPVLKHLKGSEAYRRVPTQILLINKPGEYADILNLYPDRDELLYLFITDLVKNRDGTTIMDNDKGIIRWLSHLGVNKFEEL